MEERRGAPATGLEEIAALSDVPDRDVRRAWEWEARTGGKIRGTGDPRDWPAHGLTFAATDAAGETAAGHADLGGLMDALDGQQHDADEADLETLKLRYGHARSITYNADDWGGTRWDARPKYNVGRDGEKTTAPTAQLLAERLAAAGILPAHEDRGGEEQTA